MLSNANTNFVTSPLKKGRCCRHDELARQCLY